MNTLQNTLRAVALAIGSLATTVFSADVNTSTQKSTDFEDANLTPFSVCTTQSPNYVQPFTKNGAKCAKFYWTQTGYNGTRMTKGVEACSDLNIYKEGWTAFKIYVPATGYPYNKDTIIAQIFSEGGCSSWSGVLHIINNNLTIEHRTGCVTPTTATIATNIPRDTWVRIVVQFRVSQQGAGFIKVWYNGAAQGSPSYSRTNINFAAGEWTGDTLRSDGNYGVFGSDVDNMVRLKIGMYCHDDANYSTGETRTLYYDNVVHINGNPSNAWSQCNF
jgi:Polysaccharide lyase